MLRPLIRSEALVVLLEQLQGFVVLDVYKRQDYVSGVTLSGGDPLHPDNREETGRLIDEICDRFPGKTIWLYTGYDWEEICGLPCIRKVDVVVDGEFVAGLKDSSLRWKGSSNQRVIDVQRSLLTGAAVTLDRS